MAWASFAALAMQSALLARTNCNNDIISIQAIRFNQRGQGSKQSIDIDSLETYGSRVHSRLLEIIFIVYLDHPREATAFKHLQGHFIYEFIRIFRLVVDYTQ